MTEITVTKSNGVDNFVPAVISGNAQVVLKKRYLLRDDNGEVVEDASGMFSRVAKAVAEGDREYGATNADVADTAARFYMMMSSLQFLPNSPTLMNAGTEMGTLSACFVLPLTDTMEGITRASHEQAMVQKFGGGTGFSLSDLRPKGSTISTTHGRACGPVETLRYLSATSRLVTQGGKRDGANMAVMSVHHPDILEFIECKSVEGDIYNFNISVGVSDEFMHAVTNDQSYPLYFREVPSDLDSELVEVGRLDAREVFDKIIEGAWANGEPGMIFLDEVNRDSPVSHIGTITATNPCGEQPLLPHESCNLGSINVAEIPLSYNSTYQIIDQLGVLAETVRHAVHFLDNTIDINRYSVDEIKEMNTKTRKIGLGVMGFADMLLKMGVPYDSEEAVELGASLMAFIKEKADDASEELAVERGTYTAWREDQPRMRNACRLTVAPTGTISMIAGCSSGIEPTFSLAYRKQNILGGDTTLYYANPLFEQTALTRGFYSDELLESLANGESLQERDDVPDDVKAVFQVSTDIEPHDHVMMQAAFQKSVDAGISKTINFPNDATREDVRSAYLTAWETHCKGITVYRAGSRVKEVLTKGTNNGTAENHAVTKKSRPAVLDSKTVQVSTGRGKIYVTLSFTDKGEPFELFTNHGKAGGNDSAMAEALSRMISLNLRSGVNPEDVAEQLINIQDTPYWDRGRLILSVPDAIAKVMLDHTGGKVQLMMLPEACPECGSPDVAFEEGCFKCYVCSYSKC